MIWKLVLVVGLIFVLLGLLIAAGAALLVPLNGGRTSWDEALFGIVPGIMVMAVGFPIAVLGSIFVIKNRGRK